MTCKLPLLPIERVKPVKVPTREDPEKLREVMPGYLRILLVTDNSQENMDLEFHACYPEPDENEGTFDKEVVLNAGHPKVVRDEIKAVRKSISDCWEIVSISSHIDDKWFRITANLPREVTCDEALTNFDQNFKNRLEDINARVLIFNEKALLKTINIPSHIKDMTTWDVGMVNMGKRKFININS